jgi:hypothetical protein
MLSPTRFTAAALVALVLASSPLRAQEARPAPQVHKVTMYNGTARSVYYIVKGGSARLWARYRLLEYLQNEVALVDQLQRLRMEYVADERLLEGMRTAGGGGRDIGGRGHESSIKRALADTLAQEATPEAARLLLDMLEQAETDVEAELQKLPPEQRDKLLEQLDGVERAPAKVAPAAGGAVNAPAPQPAAPPVALRPVAGSPFLAHGPELLPVPRLVSLRLADLPRCFVPASEPRTILGHEAR